MKTYKFEVDEEIYEMTMDELVGCITREFAKEILNEEEFAEFVEKQNKKLEEHRQWQEEFARTTYIPDELRDAM